MTVKGEWNGGGWNGGGMEGGGMECEFSIDRWKLLYIEWINNKVILYSTGNCTQYLVINYNVK